MTKRDELKARMQKLDVARTALQKKKDKLVKEGKNLVAVDKQLATNQLKRAVCFTDIIKTKYRKMQKEELKTLDIKVKPRGAMRKAPKHGKTQKKVKKR